MLDVPSGVVADASGSRVSRGRREKIPFFGSHWKYRLPDTDPSFLPKWIQISKLWSLDWIKSLTFWLVQNYSGPITRREVHLANECDSTWFHATHKHPLPDHEAVGVCGQVVAIV